MSCIYEFKLEFWFLVIMFYLDMHRRTIFCASLECVRAQTKLLMQQLMELDGQLSTSANIARVYEVD